MPKAERAVVVPMKSWRDESREYVVLGNRRSDGRRTTDLDEISMLAADHVIHGDQVHKARHLAHRSQGGDDDAKRVQMSASANHLIAPMDSCVSRSRARRN